MSKYKILIRNGYGNDICGSDDITIDSLKNLIDESSSSLNDVYGVGFSDKLYYVDFKPLLCVCAGNGWTEVAQLLLEKGVDVDGKFRGGKTALWEACWYNQLDMVKLLLDNKANCNMSAIHGNIKQTLLAFCAGKGWTEIAQLLLKNGADVEAQDEDGKTALWEACYYYQVGMVKVLLKHGANPNVSATHNKTIKPLLAFCAGKGWTEIAQLLLEKGVEVNAKFEGGKTALLEACSSNLSNQVEMVQLLLKYGANFEDGETALWEACYYQQAGMVNLLLDNNANHDITVKHENHDTTFLDCCQQNAPDFLPLLEPTGQDSSDSAEHHS